MKIRKQRHIIICAAVIAFLTTIGCSTEKNTSKSRWWHSFNARYNTYYNGAVAYIDGSLEKESGNKDNFTEMIPLYTVGNKASRDLGKSNFDRAIEKSQKAIKLHSIKHRPEWTKNRKKTERDIEWLNRKEYNPFLWKAWMLMGRSQFMKGSFDEAASTFAYMSRLYATQPAIYGRARAWLAKCYVEQDWIYDAEDVMTKIKRDSIHWRAQKEWDYTFADYYIHTGRYEEAIPYLRKVIRHEMRRKQKAREWYLMGQLEAALGHRQEAYKAFRHVIRLNPPYELEFNARISMTEVMAGGQYKKMIRRLRRMAASDNNKEYLDQVYYAIGNIYLSEKDTANAISAYEKGNEKSTRNGIEKGVLLLTLGDLYWNREDYTNARRCYGEAIGLLDKERNDYKQLSDRSKILDELVPYTEAVHLQDSLQALANMPEEERNQAIDRVIEALKKKEKEERAAQAETEAMQQTAGQDGNANITNNNSTSNSTSNQSGTWYFYNPMAVNQGKETFRKLWGNRENVDDWQRVNKTVVAMTTTFDEMTDEMRDSIAAAEAIEDSIKNSLDSAHNNPHKREYYLKQIPFTPEQVAESNKIIEDGLFHSGVIFKDKLDNLVLSEKNLRRLTDNYTDYEHTDEAFYNLFLLYSRQGRKDLADEYLDKLKQNHADSRWTVLLSDPYFEENAKYGVHIEDSLYVATYEAFKADRFDEVERNTELSASRFPLGANRDKFIFIGGLSKLNNGDADSCVADMEKVVKQYPKSGVSEMAGMIINGVKAGRPLHGGRFDIGDVWEQRSVILNDNDSVTDSKFIAERTTPFSLIIAYPPDSLNENRLLFELARFNFTNFIVRNFDIGIDELGGIRRMRTSGFRSYDEVLQYARQLYTNPTVMSLVQKGRAIIISDANLELLGTRYSYNDYDKFYEQHFVPLRISTVKLLTEPETIEYERQPENTSSEDDGLYNGGVIEQGLYVDDDETGGLENGDTVVTFDEQTDNKTLDNSEEGTTVVPEDNTASDENGADDATVVPDDEAAVPDKQDGTDAKAPEGQEDGLQTDGNTFVIDEDFEDEKPAGLNDNVQDSSTEIQLDDEPERVVEFDIEDKPADKPAPVVIPPVTDKPAEKVLTDDDKSEQKPRQQTVTQDDDFFMDLDDDFGGTQNNGGNKTKENKKQESFDLEDEYYELDGF